MLRAFDWLAVRPDVDARRIAIVGKGNGGVLALYAAALEPRIAKVATEKSPASYMEIVRAKMHDGITEIVVPGLTVILASVLVIGGFQTMILGVIGEYIGRIFEEVKERPLYFVDVTRNLPPPRAIRSPRMDSATPGG